MPQAALSRSIVAVLAFQVVDEDAFLAGCSAGEASAASGQREFVAPAHFVVEKIAQAPGIAGRALLFCPPSACRRPTAKGRDRRRRRTCPSSPRCPPTAGRRVDRGRRRASCACAKMAASDQLPIVFMPQLRSRRWTTRGRPALPLVAVFAQQVGPGEVEGLVALALVVAVRGPQPGRRTAASGEPGRADRQTSASRSVMGVALSDRTQSMPCDQNSRPSGSTSHHLPCVFRAEAARGLQLRPGLPAAVLVPVRGPGWRGQVGLFGLLASGRSPRPRGSCRASPCGRTGRRRRSGEEGFSRPAAGRPACEPPARTLATSESMVAAGLGHEDQQLVDVARVDPPLLAPSSRIAAHAEEFASQTRRAFSASGGW